MLGELHAKSRDPAGAALDQNSLAGFELRRIFNCGERREAGKPQGSRFGMTETIGLLGNDRGINGDPFRVGSLDTLVGYSEYRIPDGEIGDARSNRATTPEKPPRICGNRLRLYRPPPSRTL